MDRLGGTPGGTKALVNTPASKSFRQKIKVFSKSPKITGTIPVCPSSTVKQSFLNPSRMYFALPTRLVILSGSASRTSRAAIAAATDEGVGEALNISAGE